MLFDIDRETEEFGASEACSIVMGVLILGDCEGQNKEVDKVRRETGR